RFDALVVLQREAASALSTIHRIMPGLGLPDASAHELLKRLTGLPDTVRLSATKPFAIVFTEAGWAAVIPCKDVGPGGERMKALDSLYAVAGDPAVVEGYRPGFRKGFFLPGDCSVVTNLRGFSTLGSTLTRAFSVFHLDFSGLDAALPPMPEDVERIDLAMRFNTTGVRIDLRAAPQRDSPLARLLTIDALKPTNSAALATLPTSGTLYLESGTSPALLAALCEAVLDPRSVYAERTDKQRRWRRAWQRGLEVLGTNAGAVVDLEPDGSGTAIVVSHVSDSDAADEFFGSDEFATLLATAAGPGGNLRYKAAEFQRHGANVGVVTGHVSHERNLAWRRSKDKRLATLSMILRGPVVMYVARQENKLCWVVGKRSRAVMESLLDRLHSGTSSSTPRDLDIAALFSKRIASFTINLAELFDGLRDAAPYWHPNGARLQNQILRWGIPASGAITVEGDALRVAIRLAPTPMAEAYVRLTRVLSAPEPGRDRK
ncbi:MAG: hypothetical protein OER88_06795, partial [Planctomycetota bacterium]|nr:hypothetical protein [Planctomycetota bacterium]